MNHAEILDDPSIETFKNIFKLLYANGIRKVRLTDLEGQHIIMAKKAFDEFNNTIIVIEDKITLADESKFMSKFNRQETSQSNQKINNSQPNKSKTKPLGKFLQSMSNEDEKVINPVDYDNSKYIDPQKVLSKK